MKALFHRELRRLAPYALALVALTLGIALTLALQHASHGTLGTLFMGSVVATAGVLAVAAIAPDTSSGGTAFLARLPLGARPVLATKLAAVTALWAVAALLEGVVCDLFRPATPLLVGWKGTLTAAATVFAFGSGLVASTISSKTMSALLLAPIVAVTALLAAALALFGAVGLDGMSERFGIAILAALAAVLGVAAWVGYVRGDRHRVSARPGALAAAVAGIGMVVFLAGTKSAQAWTLAHCDAELSLARERVLVAPRGDLAAVELRTALWCGIEERVAVLATRTGEAWVAPVRGVRAAAFSPDGRELLLVGRRPLAYRLDLATRRATPLVLSGPEGAIACWRDGRPLLVAGVGDLALATNGRVAAQRSLEGRRLVGVRPSDTRLVTVADDGVWLTEAPRTGSDAHLRAERVASWPSRSVASATALSPRGERLLAARADGVLVVDLRGVDVRSGTVARLDVADPASAAPGVDRATWCPDESRVALELGSEVACFDAATGKRLGSLPLPETNRADELRFRPEAAVWSPDGRFVAPCTGERLDLATGVVAHASARIGFFLDPDRVLFFDDTLRVWSVASGTLVASLLEGR